MSDQGLEERLEVGLDIFLDPQPGVANSPRYPGHVRGWESGRYILLGLRPGAGAPVVRKGKECVVRFMHDGEVWGFTAQFGDSPNGADISLLHLHWPRQVARLQVRKYERVAIEVPCTIHLDEEQSESGTIGDISGGGCSMVSSTALNVDDVVHLSFRMPEGGNVSRRPVRIRNRRDLAGGRFKYGCQFQEEKEVDRGIELFVARKKAMDRGESAPHPQVLVLSRSDEDVQIAQEALSGSSFETVAATGILDLGHRLHTCNAVGILISFEQKELSAMEIIPLIRQSQGVEEMPLFPYGSVELHDQALSMGATLCLKHLGDAGEIVPHLPKVEVAVAEPEDVVGQAATDPEEPDGQDVEEADSDTSLDADLDEYGEGDEGDDDDDDEIDIL